MGRTFDLPTAGDLPAAGCRYSIRVTSIDEGWQLWIYEGRRPLTLGGIVSMDAALEAWRTGDDAVVRMVKRIRADLAAGKLSFSLPSDARQAGGVAACEDGPQSSPP